MKPSLCLTLPCLAAFVLAPAAVAFPFTSNQATVMTRVTAGGVTDTDQDTTTSPSDPSVFTRSGVNDTSGLNLSDARSNLLDLGDDELRYTARSSVRLRRSGGQVSASGSAFLEPGQQFVFEVPDAPLRLEYRALGVIDITNEMQANNSFINFSITVFNQSTGQTLLRESRFSPDGYDIVDSVTLNASPGDTLSVGIDNGATGFIGGAETTGDISTDLQLRFLVPEPGSLAVLGAVGLSLVGRRRRTA